MGEPQIPQSFNDMKDILKFKPDVPADTPFEDWATKLAQQFSANFDKADQRKLFSDALDAYRYQRFDPKSMIALMKRKSGDRNFENDLVFLVALFYTRGAN